VGAKRRYDLFAIHTSDRAAVLPDRFPGANIDCRASAPQVTPIKARIQR
jgi:hypothetical protein